MSALPRTQEQATIYVLNPARVEVARRGPMVFMRLSPEPVRRDAELAPDRVPNDIPIRFRSMPREPGPHARFLDMQRRRPRHAWPEIKSSSRTLQIWIFNLERAGLSYMLSPILRTTTIRKKRSGNDSNMPHVMH